MHGTWKEYENYSMSLLMAKQADVIALLVHIYTLSPF